MSNKINPIRQTSPEAIDLARTLIANARFGAVSFLLAETQTPSVSRIAVTPDPEGSVFSLISDLATHTDALRANPACALLLGEPGVKGDPLIHPRITLQCRALFVERTERTFTDLKAQYLQTHPKAALYIDFTDFLFVRFPITSGALNGGFGKAFRLTAQDLAHHMD